MKGTSQGELGEAFREGREGPPGVISRRPIPPPNVRFGVVRGHRLAGMWMEGDHDLVSAIRRE
jgi:hypothetical protein